MVKGVTDSGFEFEVNEKITKDFLFVKAYRLANHSDPYKQIDGFTDLVSMLFDDKEEDYYKFLKEHFDGIVPADVLGKDIGSVIRQVEKASESAKK